MLSRLFTATFDDRNESLPPHLLSILDFLGRVVFLYTTTANTMQGGNRGWNPRKATTIRVLLHNNQ